MGKGGLCKVVDGLLFVYFVVLAVVVPVMHSPACLPADVVPAFSAEFNRWFAGTTDDYLMSELPHFFVGLLSLELFFQWPLVILSVYAIATAKPWFSTVALIYGVSAFSISAALMSEVILAKRASGTMLMVCYSYLGFGVLALFRGLFPAAVGSKGEGGPNVLQRKKRA